MPKVINTNSEVDRRELSSKWAGSMWNDPAVTRPPCLLIGKLSRDLRDERRLLSVNVSQLINSTKSHKGVFQFLFCRSGRRSKV